MEVVEDRYDAINKHLADYMSSHRRAAEKQKIVTNTGLVYVKQVESPQRITVGRLSVQDPRPIRWFHRTKVAQYLSRDERQIWFPIIDFNGGEYVRRIGETFAGSILEGWRQYQDVINDPNDHNNLADNLKPLYYEAVGMLKLIGAVMLGPKDVVTIDGPPAEDAS